MRDDDWGSPRPRTVLPSEYTLEAKKFARWRAFRHLVVAATVLFWGYVLLRFVGKFLPDPLTAVFVFVLICTAVFQFLRAAWGYDDRCQRGTRDDHVFLQTRRQIKDMIWWNPAIAPVALIVAIFKGLRFVFDASTRWTQGY